jgi:preprotein translocase subunit YajC
VALESIVGLFLIAAFMGGLAFFGTRPEKKKQNDSE